MHRNTFHYNAIVVYYAVVTPRTLCLTWYSPLQCTSHVCFVIQDAHNCCPDFDPERKCLLFAVYDGHGGTEILFTHYRCCLSVIIHCP